ncbi:MAG: hypothetical protein R2743_26160 [Ilumatobacteraceae bacterium]
MIALATAWTLALYVVLRPENYALTPNSLDPVFYTGYSINFDDVLNAVGDRHYFVSRWSAYLPMYVADMVFGPVAGRLLWRLVLAVALVVALWSLGRRWSWTIAQRLLVATVVLSTPMFVRLLLRLRGVPRRRTRDRARVSRVEGVPSLVERRGVRCPGRSGVRREPDLDHDARPRRPVLRRRRRSRVWERVWLVTVVSVTALAVVLAGLLLFRWNYGIENVYQPSIDFVRRYQAPPVDHWKSPRFEWLEKYTWLYAAPLILVTSAVLAIRRAVRFDRFEVAALSLCAAQYAYQWFDQFVRGGYGLELSFYWSFSLPPYLVALAVVVGRLSMGVPAKHLAAVAGAWIVLLAIGVPTALELPPGIWLVPLAVVVTAAAVTTSARWGGVALAAILGLTAWMQVGAPAYDPTAYWFLNTSPRYDQVFRRAGSQSELMFHESIWFADEMDRIVNDASTSFVALGGWSKSIVGLYAPHVVGRVVTLTDDGRRLSEIAKAEVKSGSRPIVAVFGPRREVADMLSTFPSDLGVGTVLLDETHDSALGYRLVVYAMPDATRLPFTWRADALPIANGSLVGTEAQVGPGDEPGFVTFGPYQMLQPGRYLLEVSYRSSLGADEIAGLADVSSQDASTIASEPLPGTAGRSSTVRIEFEVGPENGTARWEFRSSWTGAGTLVIESLTVSAN